jgi:hypothetical protein
MLTVTIETAAIVAVQREYRETGIAANIATAVAIGNMRFGLVRAARRFAERQVRAVGAGKPYVRDGRAATLRHAVFDHLARHRWPHGWPIPAAAILHGLRLGERLPLPRDIQSYLAPLYDGPPQARQYGELVGLAVYFDPLRELRILWIGRESDFEDAREAVAHATDDFTDWSRIAPKYHP